MVKIAIAGASGQLAREILDGLAKTGKHEIIGLARKDPKSLPKIPGVRWEQTDYEDKPALVQLLRGVHTVLCFFVSHKDLGGVSQKRLIDAAIEAGVERYAASEWSIGGKLEDIIDVVPWYSSKLDVRSYLQEVNKNKKASVLEYSLFHPGLFMNYLGYPRQTAKHITLFPILFDFEATRAVLGEKGLNKKIVYTTIEDIVGVVAHAVEYKGEWPKVGGIVGCQTTVAELLELGETLRGKPFNVEWVKEEDAKLGNVQVSWLPPLGSHVLADIPKADHEAFQKAVLTGNVIAISEEAWNTTDEWNQLLPDYKFTSLEQFLKQVWI